MTETKKDHIPLDAAEIANLWTSYMSDSMFLRVFQHFGQQLEDPEIHPLLQYAIDLNNKHLHTILKRPIVEDKVYIHQEN